MEVKMNKEIRNYQESMFMGLNLRQCIFSLLAITVAVGIYFGLGKYVGQEMTGWMCILGAAPFAACGFFQYHGMNAEQFAWAYIKSLRKESKVVQTKKQYGDFSLTALSFASISIFSG